jgi:hypothetical protein
LSSVCSPKYRVFQGAAYIAAIKSQAVLIHFDRF